MPQNQAKFQVNQFTAGLVTDANPLAEGGPYATDELNCEIMSHGGRRRRRGAAAEVAYLLHGTSVSDSQKEDWAFDTFEWKAVAGVAGLNFLVYQQGDTLWFYDKGQSPISSGLKSFSVDLTSFKTSAATTAQLRNTRVSVATGKGVIFVCGSTIEPFYVEYNSDTDSITTTQITIQIRDFEEQAPEIGPQDEVTTSPTTGNHLYDLLNQGWYQQGLFMRDDGSTNRNPNSVALLLYFDHSSAPTTFPRKNTPWHIGKYLVAEDSGTESNAYISPQQIRSAPSGNTLAPFGHYILDAFNKDRAQAIRDENDFTTSFFVADINTIPVETEDERPVFVAFYAGRAWYLLKNNLYFSQQLDQDSLDKAGKCYQEGDPTNEAESDIIATDGGLIPIPDMGRGTSMAVTDNALIVFADNGIWTVSGTSGASFSAVDFSVSKLSTISCQSPKAVIEAEGLVLFLGETGAYVIQPGDVRALPQINDIVEGRITEFYNAIPQNSKRNAKAIYDPLNKVIHFMYKATNDSSGVNKNRFAYDRFLNFSLKFSAWYPWSVTVNSTNQIVGGTIAGGVIATFEEDLVVDSNGNAVVTSGGEDVIVFQAATTEQPEAFKFLMLKDNAATIGSFDDLDFYDWGSNDYTSYIETFYHIADDYMGQMQAPYTYVYFRRTEEAVEDVSQANFVFDNFTTGGGTFSSGFISELADGAGGTGLCETPPQGSYITGEDGNRYTFAIGGGGVGSDVDTMRLYQVENTSTTLAKTEVEMKTEAVNAGHFDNGAIIGGTGGTGDINPVLIPGTQYVVVIGTQYGGVDSSKTLYYYKIDTNGALELVESMALREDNLSAQFQPENTGPNAYTAMGIVGTSATVLDSGDANFATHNTPWHQYPIALAYRGAGPTASKVVVIPSINQALGGLDNENVASSDVWDKREADLSTPFDSNIMFLTDAYNGTTNKLSFFIPTASGARLFIPFYRTDIDRHIAGTETTTSSYLQANDSANTGGFMSSADVDLVLDGSC